MSTRSNSRFARTVGIALCLSLWMETRSSTAQESPTSNETWPIGNLIVRGQDPEFEAVESAGELFPNEEEDHIETDRDSFTPATTIVGQGRSILEFAYSYIDNRDVFDTHSFPESLLRYGLNERIELRLGWNYEVGGAANAVSGSSIGEVEEEGAKLERESEISYGLKWAVTEQDGWRPQSAFIAQAFTPTSGPDTYTDFVGTYVVGWELENGYQLDGSLRYCSTSEESDHFNQWAPSVVVKVPVADRWYGHVEYFAIASSGRAEEKSVHYFSPGVHYLVTPDLEVGIRFGWGLNQDASNFFNNVGVGWRF